MTTTPETVTTGDKPHLSLAGLAQQAAYAYRFAKADHTAEALEHLDAIQRLTAAYRDAVDPSPTNPTDGPIHTWFNVSYCNYQVLHRTLMQSMPIEWQERMAACLTELDAAFEHVPQPEVFDVQAATEHEVSDLDGVQRNQLGITADWHRGETPPDGLSPEDLAEWRDEHENPDGPDYYDALSGNVMRSDERVLLPAIDPVPHYNRGRTYIEPRPAGGE